MRRCWITFVLLVASAGAHDAFGQEWARKMFETTSHDFGTLARGAQAEFAFELTNLYEEDIHIAGVRSSCGCATPTITKRTLKTWEKGSIVANFNTRSFLGHRSATITVTIDRPYYAEVQLTVRGHIRPDVVFRPGAVELGQVNQGSIGNAMVEISYAGRSDWRIVDVRSANEHFEVELDEAERRSGRIAYRMHVRLLPTAPAGYLQDQLTLVTNDAQARIIPLAVEGRIVPALSVSPASLYLGRVSPGQSVSKRLVVRGQQPFEITAVECDDKSFAFDIPAGESNLHFIPVTFTASGRPGNIHQSIRIRTNLGDAFTATCTATATVSGE